MARRRAIGAELSEADESGLDEIKALTGMGNESELIRLGLRALLREQRRLHGLPSVAATVPPRRTRRKVQGQQPDTAG